MLKPFSILSESDILNEFRAIEKLCVRSSDKNIIAVYRYGKLVDSLYYYIDMELCDLNLEEYIYESLDLKESFTNHHRCSLPPLHTKGIWQIMHDISQGLAFIHENKEVHRDLKPKNSIPLLFVGLIRSFIFFCDDCLEDC